MSQGSEERKGLLLGFSAYAVWGFFPLYWGLLAPSSPTEILAHRIIWSLCFMALLNTVFGLWPAVRDAWRSPRTRLLLALASLLVTVNWGVYIWAVANDHVVDAAFGYFINPLVSVAFGILTFGERLRRAQWVAIAIAVSAVVVLTFDAGSVPWTGLVLAATFGSYGLVKKLANVDAMASLTVETAVTLPFALAYLGYLEITGQAAFLHTSLGHTATVLSAGIVTAVPLLGFGAAAVRIPLSTLGLLQYLTPVLQFLLGVLVFHESMSGVKWAGFAWLWVGLVVFTWDMVRNARKA